jgi:4-hydroxybenzoate polyprenyltransferase
LNFELEGSMAHRFWVYQRERFPILAYAPLIATFSSSTICFSALLRGRGALPGAGVLLGAFLSSLLFFLQLRIADEFKDAEEDRRYRPYRPVPRGLVSLRELGALGALSLAVQLGLALWQSVALVPLLLLTWGYGALMSVEFFVPRWLKAHPTVYMLSHMLILSLIDLYVTAWDWAVAGAEPPRQLIWLLAISLCNGLVIEIGRKIRAPADEEHGVETYSVLWGPRRATLAWLAPLALTGLCSVAVARYLDSALLTAVLLGGCLAVALATGMAFVRAPASGLARRIEQVSSLWTFVVYLCLGLLPALM